LIQLIERNVDTSLSSATGKLATTANVHDDRPLLKKGWESIPHSTKFQKAK
jgi:hypothetical protein